MRTTSQQYQTPTITRTGDLIETTRARLVSNTESDQSPKDLSGSVGFGM